MKTDTYQVKLIFLTPILGSQPSHDIKVEYLSKKNGIEIPSDEEEYLPDLLEKGTTVFFRHPKTGQPQFRAHQIKGFLKAAGSALNGKSDEGTRALKSKIENYCFIAPLYIPIEMPAGGEMDYLERPLRAATAMGDRVTIARSEMIPENSTCKFGLSVLAGGVPESVVLECLDYGFYKGLGQWRNGDYGRFRYEIAKEA